MIVTLFKLLITSRLIVILHLFFHHPVPSLVYSWARTSVTCVVIIFVNLLLDIPDWYGEAYIKVRQALSDLLQYVY